MSYPNTDNENFLINLLQRKEFYSLKVDPERNFRDPGDEFADVLAGKHLKMHSHQLFVKNMINPNTPYKRLHLMHATGTGKTLAAVSIAKEFVNVYRKLYATNLAKLPSGRRNYAELDRGTPSVFVLGFGGTKAAFVRELLRYPEFGFVSISEKEELSKRQKIAEAGLPDDIKHLKEYYSSLKKRITNKAKGGMFKFFGYDEFVNRLFITSEDVKLTDLELELNQRLRSGEEVTLEDIFADRIKSGKIQVNKQLLGMLENSLIIGDEIHNTYNMNSKNNRGVALQYVLDSVPSVRFVSLSATPINNSPTEVVELVNYLLIDRKVTKKELFIGGRKLLSGKLELIGQLSRGKISFLQDVNVKYFPRRVFLGDDLILPKDLGDFHKDNPLPYLKFIECPMSQLHQMTYNDYLNNNTGQSKESEFSEFIDEQDINSSTTDSTAGNTITDNAPDGVLAETAAEITDNDFNLNEFVQKPQSSARSSGKSAKTSAESIKNHDVDIDEDIEDISGETPHAIPTDGYAIYDIVFPNPTSDIGMFRSNEVRSKLVSASQEWKDKNKISVKKFSATNSVIVGDFLLRENIGKYSTKCEKLLDILSEIIDKSGGDPNKTQKIMIYHDRVKMSGVLLLQELLRANNILDEHSEPTDNTLCCICGKSLSSHNGNSTHEYKPIRFVIAHSDIDKIIMDQSLAKFNNPDNLHGHNYMILIGSKIIKESYDFKDIQNLIIMSLPINIPTLIQVFGRCIRKHSHINLPVEQRRVFIRILISTINKNYDSVDSVSPELYRYADKLSSYIIIQNIERELNRWAVDADIHRDIIMPPLLKEEYFRGSDKPHDLLGNLYFEPAVKIPEFNQDQLNLTTFRAYKHYEDEIHTICFIIKRLFMSNTIWTYDDLWAAVRRPPIGIEVNPKLFAESNFIIALNNLIEITQPVLSSARQQEMTEARLVEKLFDYNERYIYRNGTRHKIVQIDKYYILFPVVDLPTNPLNTTYIEYIEHIRDKERAMIKELAVPTDRALVDVETYLRGNPKKSGVRISIDLFVKESKENINYVAKKEQFIANYKDREQLIPFLFNFSAQFQMSFLEEAITYMMLGPKAVVDSSAYDLYKRVVDLLTDFRVIIYLNEVAKYKDTAKQYKLGLPNLPSDTPLGYMTTKSVRLFDPQVDLASTKITPETLSRGKWIEISKISLNRHIGYKENDVIVGYLESAEDYMRFKLRKPIHKIKDDFQREALDRRLTKSEIEGTTARTSHNDTRLIEKGIVCVTKNKRDLLQIIASLGVSTSKLSKSDIRIKKLCEIIKLKLIENEIKERKRDSRYKYLYSWWDESVNLTAI